MKSDDRISNRLAEARERAAISAAEIATAAGVARQTIYAIESGAYTPNTALALRLARILSVSVEDLFCLDEDPIAPSSAVNIEWLGSRPAAHGEPVRLSRVGDRTVAVPATAIPAYLPAADGMLASRTRAVPFEGTRAPARLVVAGCDPALSVLAKHAAAAGVDIALVSSNSTRALELLRRGLVHMAGTHLPGPHSMGRALHVVTFAAWQEGWVVAPGNPKRVRSAADFARRDVSIVNRERGAASRLLLDRELKKAGVPATAVSGYDRLAPGHLAAAWLVSAGLADCCVATEAAARAFRLDFVPLGADRFDFVIADEATSNPMVRTSLDTMHRAAFRRELELMAGYDTRDTGRVVE